MNINRKKRNKFVKNLFALTFIIFLLGNTVKVEAKNKYEDLTTQKRIVSLKLNQTTNINYTSNRSDDKKYYSDNREVADYRFKGKYYS